MSTTSLNQLLHINLVSSVDVSGLLEPQKRHVIDLIGGIETHGFACDLSGTGTGKTYMASAIARHIEKTSGADIYILAPKCVIPAWRSILGIMGVKNFHIFNYEKVARGKLTRVASKRSRQDPRTKTRVEKDMLFWEIPQDSFIIFDESHKCKGMKSANSELLLMAHIQKFRFLTVSATQAVCPMDMFVFGYILGEHSFMDETRDIDGVVHKNFYAWGREFGGDWADTRDGFKVDIKTTAGQARMKKLHDKLFSMGIARRLTTADMGSAFANNHIMPGVFDMGDKGVEIREILEQMESEIAALAERGYSNHIFAAITKARRQAELLKAPTIVEQILEHRREDKSIAVFVNYGSTIDAIISRVEKELGKGSCGVIRGNQSERERQAHIDNFQDNKIFVIICNMAAGGVGVSLHDIHGGHPRVALISPSYSPIQLIQAFGRIHRAEGKSECLQYIIYCAGTIEEEIAVKVGGKLGNLDALNDGDMFGKDYGLPDEVQKRFADELEELIEELDLNPVAA